MVESDGEPKEASIMAQKGTPLTKRIRRYLRPLHRDFGYLIVGLTFVYAISGLAVNHIDDWNACLLYTSPSPRDATLSRMPSSA